MDWVVSTPPNSRKIHDRFIVMDDKCWAIGTSIKDLGNKDTTIKNIDEVCYSIKGLFNERWE